jgi:exopolyphosphatase / guanosine-5'-triphosphate,3'-diphosphate pyrophosphatase
MERGGQASPSARATDAGANVKIATLDVGTNTVLTLVAEYMGHGQVRPLAELSRITRLGRGVDQANRLDPQAAEITLNTISEFVERARNLGAQKIAGVATSVLRDSSDAAEFIARVRARTGVDLQVISGLEEAELSYLAVVKGLRLGADRRLLIVDIGGGSTELIRAEPNRELQVASLQIGSVRMTERFVRHDPPAASEAAEMRAEVDDAIEAVGWTFRPNLMVGIAGTVTTICAVALGLSRYDAGAVHGYRLSEAQVNESLALFSRLKLLERKGLAGMVEGRADVIFAGTMILARIMHKFGTKTLVVSDQGVRWGLMWRELEKAEIG